VGNAAELWVKNMLWRLAYVSKNLGQNLAISTNQLCTFIVVDFAVDGRFCNIWI